MRASSSLVFTTMNFVSGTFTDWSCAANACFRNLPGHGHVGRVTKERTHDGQSAEHGWFARFRTGSPAAGRPAAGTAGVAVAVLAPAVPERALLPAGSPVRGLRAGLHDRRTGPQPDGQQHAALRGSGKRSAPQLRAEHAGPPERGEVGPGR